MKLTKIILLAPRPESDSYNEKDILVKMVFETKTILTSLMAKYIYHSYDYFEGVEIEEYKK